MARTPRRCVHIRVTAAQAPSAGGAQARTWSGGRARSARGASRACARTSRTGRSTCTCPVRPSSGQPCGSSRLGCRPSSLARAGREQPSVTRGAGAAFPRAAHTCRAMVRAGGVCACARAQANGHVRGCVGRTRLDPLLRVFCARRVPLLGLGAGQRVILGRAPVHARLGRLGRQRLVPVPAVQRRRSQPERRGLVRSASCGPWPFVYSKQESYVAVQLVFRCQARAEKKNLAH